MRTLRRRGSLTFGLAIALCSGSVAKAEVKPTDLRQIRALSSHYAKNVAAAGLDLPPPASSARRRPQRTLEHHASLNQLLRDPIASIDIRNALLILKIMRGTDFVTMELPGKNGHMLRLLWSNGWAATYTSMHNRAVTQEDLDQLGFGSYDALHAAVVNQIDDKYAPEDMPVER